MPQQPNLAQPGNVVAPGADRPAEATPTFGSDPAADKKAAGQQKAPQEDFKEQLRTDVPVQLDAATPASQAANPLGTASAAVQNEQAARIEMAEQMRLASEKALASADGKEVKITLKDSLLPATSFTVNTNADGKLVFTFDTGAAASAKFLEQNSDNIRQHLLEKAGVEADIRINRRDDDSGDQGQQQQQGRNDGQDGYDPLLDADG